MGITPREIRALEIAARFRIVESGGLWNVPSQSGRGQYTVQIEPQTANCSCPDHELRQEDCKHILAVKYTLERERGADGSMTVTETFEVTKKTTYKQDWPKYNAAQVAEQDTFQTLLYALCSDLVHTPQVGRGQRRLPLSDAMFASIFKVYSTMSARRFMSDLREAQKRGYIRNVPHYNSVLNYLENPGVRPILTKMIELSALPLKALEESFAVDSSGFGVSRFFRWFDHKYGVEKDRRDWVKVHVMCGTRTNIITAVEIHGRDAADAPQLRPLVSTTHRNFGIKEVSADKGYLSYDNAKAIADIGAVPFIAFKKNSVMGDVRKEGHTKTQAWTDMYCHFASNRKDFLRRYHLRSNVESCFSMIKPKFLPVLDG